MDEWKNYEDTLISSRKFLREEFLPESISIDVSTISTETAYQVRNQQTLLYIKSGTGNLVVNGTSHPVSPGSCILLHFFHFHKLAPSNGSALEVFRCLIPSTTYQFMIMIPGADFRQLERTLNPIFCTVPEQEQKTFLKLLNDMATCEDDCLRNLAFFELFGRRNRLFIHETKI